MKSIKDKLIKHNNNNAYANVIFEDQFEDQPQFDIQYVCADTSTVDRMRESFTGMQRNIET